LLPPELELELELGLSDEDDSHPPRPTSAAANKATNEECKAVLRMGVAPDR
jgi:hypothetical protein